MEFSWCKNIYKPNTSKRSLCSTHPSAGALRTQEGSGVGLYWMFMEQKVIDIYCFSKSSNSPAFMTLKFLMQHACWRNKFVPHFCASPVEFEYFRQKTAIRETCATCLHWTTKNNASLDVWLRISFRDGIVFLHIFLIVVG